MRRCDGGSTITPCTTSFSDAPAGPGGTRIASVLAAADPRAETPIESLTRLRYREFGLPEPVSQAQVYDPDGHEIGRVDFLFWQHGVVGEADGMLKYDREGALREEKRREQSFRGYGLEVLRNNWQEALPGRSPESGCGRSRPSRLLRDAPGPGA